MKKIKEKIKECKSLSEMAIVLLESNNTIFRNKTKKLLEDNNINWQEIIINNKKDKIRICLHCGKEFIHSKPRKYCSTKCFYAHRKKVKNTCLVCNTPLSKNASKYCSISCMMEYQYKTYIQNWKDGLVSGGDRDVSDTIRKYLFLKYNNKCQLCGWSEINPTTNRIPLQVHHIDGDCTNNKEENLQLLCPNCHSLTPNYGKTKNHISKRIDKRLKRQQK